MTKLKTCIVSELLERAERRQDYQRPDAIKRANPTSWKHVNLYEAYCGTGYDRDIVLKCQDLLKRTPLA
jgi:hypothetical protein